MSCNEQILENPKYSSAKFATKTLGQIENDLKCFAHFMMKCCTGGTEIVPMTNGR